MADYNDKMELNVKFSSDISFIASDACDRYLLQMYIAKGIQEAFELVGCGCNNFTEVYLRTAEQTLAIDDVAPVVRGRWEFEYETIDDVEYCCTVCDWIGTNANTFHYCQNCGAKMDGGQDDA